MTEPPPTFSVAIRGFRPDLLREAMASVLAQTYGDFELIVYDDSGGLDDVLAEFGDPRIRHVRVETEQDPALKIAAALSMCRGAFIGMLDDDDWYEPPFLERVLAAFEAEPDVGVVFTNHFWAMDGLRFPRTLSLAGGTHRDFLRTVVTMWPVGLSAAMLRREAWERGQREKPISADIWADRFTWLRTAEAGWPFHYIDEPLATYRVHSGQMSKRAASMRDKGVNTLASFSFDDPESEHQRRTQLAVSLTLRAAWHLEERRGRRALADLKHARELAPQVMRGRRAAMRVLAAMPVAGPLAAALWRRRPQRPVLGDQLAEARRRGLVEQL